MRGRSLGGLDAFRLVCALLVAANHTSPLSSFSPLADHMLTQVLARLAVPFFLMVSGYFLLPRLRTGGRAVLFPVLRRVLALYGLATLLYLPLQLYKGYRPGPLALLRDLLFDGTFYHLWYLPALALGLVILYVLTRHVPRPLAWIICGLLYLLGLLGDSCYALTAACPPLAALYGGLFHLFGQTRNGLFLAPLFLLLGDEAARRTDPLSPGANAAGFTLSLALLLAEGLMVHTLDLARYSTMYLALPPALLFLFRLLCARDIPARPRLRTLSTAVYLIHPWMIVAVRGLARAVGLVPLLVEQSLVHYLAVCLLSLLAGWAWVLLRARVRRPAPPAPAAGRAWVEVDHGALAHNVEVLQGLLPPGGRLMAVVKADGYGHGAAAAARTCAASGLAAFAVATVSEGAALRDSGVRGDILVLGRAWPEEVPLALSRELLLTVADAAHARELSALPQRPRVHIKVDTGMHRLGLLWDDTEAIAALYGGPLRVAGLYTHLAAADSRDPGDEAFTRGQIRRYYTLIGALKSRGLSPGVLHLQASAGLLRFPGLPCDFARPGLALYGVCPGGCPDPGLIPALSLRCRVASVRALEPGEAAGYSRAFTAGRPTRLAVLSVGYADGLPRTLGQGAGRVLLHGRAAPIVGLICMDQCFADVTGIPGVVPGDRATLIGRDGGLELTAGAAAEAAGTIPNELLSRLGARLPRLDRPQREPAPAQDREAPRLGPARSRSASIPRYPCGRA